MARIATVCRCAGCVRPPRLRVLPMLPAGPSLCLGRDPPPTINHRSSAAPVRAASREGQPAAGTTANAPNPTHDGHRSRRSRIPVALVAPQGAATPGRGAGRTCGGGSALRCDSRDCAAGQSACSDRSFSRGRAGRCHLRASRSPRPALAHSGRRGAADARIGLHALHRQQRPARCEERRPGQALHRPALQCHGPPGRLHRRLRQARPAASGHVAADGAGPCAWPVRRRRRRTQDRPANPHRGAGRSRRTPAAP